MSHGRSLEHEDVRANAPDELSFPARLIDSVLDSEDVAENVIADEVDFWKVDDIDGHNE